VLRSAQTVDKKLFSPEGGRIALSANERIAEFLNFAIQAKFAYVNKLCGASLRALPISIAMEIAKNERVSD